MAQVIKSEIIRLAKKEAKATAQPVRKASLVNRKEIVQLKRRLVALEKTIKNLLANAPNKSETQDAEGNDGNDGKRVRITAKGMRALRAKWNVSQVDFGKLLGVSVLTVWKWEQAKGALGLRKATKAKILAVRNLTPSEAKKRLEEVGKTSKVVKVVKKARKTKKRG